MESKTQKNEEETSDNYSYNYGTIITTTLLIIIPTYLFYRAYKNIQLAPNYQIDNPIMSPGLAAIIKHYENFTPSCFTKKLISHLSPASTKLLMDKNEDNDDYIKPYGLDADLSE